MNVSLTPELESYVEDKVASGRYASASEVLREALRALQEREHDRQAELRSFRAEIDRRVTSLDRGEALDGEQVFKRIRAKSKSRRKSA